MRRTEALQGVRKNKFLDILGRCEAAEFSQVEAAELLGVGERTFERSQILLLPEAVSIRPRRAFGREQDDL